MTVVLEDVRDPKLHRVMQDSDTLTVLTSAGPRLTKVWDSATGKPQAYENARQVSVREVCVSGIRDLSALLTTLEPQRNSCIIRGRFIGHKAARERYPAEIEADAKRGKALQVPKDGFTLRRLAFFDDQPLHYFFLDIDRYRPEGIDPVVCPEQAIDQYISRHLPPCFEGASYHWQLSSGAGHPDNAGVLKAHVAFWLRTPQLGEDLELWVRASGLQIDPAVFRTVQPNYTAAPVFINNVADPVPRRSGLREGWLGDDVDLVLEGMVVERIRGARKSRKEMVDPREKDGLVGLFCRTFEIEDVVERWLGDVFEFVDDWRLTFLRSDSGAREGAGVTENRQGIFNTHASDPLLNRATNKWDLVRHYVFGHLDEAIDRDDRSLLGPGGWPSQAAMTEMVRELPEIQAALGQARSQRDALMQELQTLVSEATDARDLQETVAPRIAQSTLSELEREQLAVAIQQRARDLAGVRLQIGTVRGWLRPKGGAGGVNSVCPEWARPWVFITDGDKFFNLETKQEVSPQGFRAMFNRFMPVSSNGGREKADQFAIEEWNTPVVAHKAYFPGAATVFEMFGLQWANLYRPEAAPQVPDAMSSDDLAAIELVKQHLDMYLADPRERRLLLSWIAQNVQHPGVKIRWAPYIHGVPGDGKSFFLELVGVAMGGQNVRSLNGSTLESNFTDWAVGYAVVGIEEMKQHGHNRYDIMNRLKPFITNTAIEIHPKGKASYTAPNLSNYVIFSNYLDGAPVDEGDRRYMFLSSQLTMGKAAQLTQEGYFKRLFDAVNQHAGAIRKWLLELALDGEFDANGRAPETAVKQTVVELSKNELEMTAEDLIEQGTEGVGREVVSSAHLTRALAAAGIEAPSTSRVNTLLTKLEFRFLFRRRWDGRTCRVWARVNSEMTWEKAQRLLDATKEDFLA